MARPRKVFLVHGWSVQETTTYQALHEKLIEAGFAPTDVFLGRYVSLDDAVEVRDLARGLQRALLAELGPPPWRTRFHILTHSTGALVVRQWIAHHYLGAFASERALGNVVFLAGPHFGSRLAHHGRSMLAHAAYLGETGAEILRDLELGSAFSWATNRDFLEPGTWRRKGIRLYALIGDRVKRHPFRSRIFPAGYERGSDMVVRVASGNPNFRRFLLDASRGRLDRRGEIQSVPFAALASYTHSGPETGIMNSITRRARPDAPRYQNLRLILECLRVETRAAHEAARRSLRNATAETRRRKRGFAQLDLRFRDRDGEPITDFAFALGAVVGGRDRPSRTVAHIHKNRADGSHLTAFLDLRHFEPRYTYFLKLDCESGTPLVSIEPRSVRIEVSGARLAEIIAPDQVSQIEVVFDRAAAPELFAFHRADDPDLHVRWDRSGRITGKRLPTR